MGHGSTYPCPIPRESTKPLFAGSTPRPSQNGTGRAESPNRRTRPEEFLNKLNRSFFEKSFQQNPSIEDRDHTENMWSS
ncbi:hypothetical protein Trydic_g6588 [Trypoxylus dichotomus]